MKNKIISIFYGLVLVSLLVTLIRTVSAIYPLTSGKVLMLCQSCLVYLVPFGQKILFLLFLITVLSLLINIVRIINFKNSLRKIVNKSKLLKQLEDKHDLSNKIIIFDDKTPQAFCIGILKPQIFLSTELLKIMSRLELETIIIHEKQHLDNNDNFVLLILQVLKNTFFFLPIFRDIVDHYEIQNEIRADDLAIRKSGQNNVLSSLRKLIDYPVVSTTLVSSFLGGQNIEPRIQTLLKIKRPAFMFSRNNVVLSLCTLLLVANVVASKLEVHSSSQQITSVCIDDSSCQEICGQPCLY
jgi:beta-lactamase regulating signal transducer with metallopeptidase domain